MYLQLQFQGTEIIMHPEFISLFKGNLAIAAAVMLITWIVSRQIKNSSIIDIAWVLSFILMAALSSLLAPGWELRRLIVFAMIAIWGLRLAIQLSIRIHKMHPKEDSRYEALRQKWGKFYAIKSLLFYLLQAIAAALLSTVFLIPVFNIEERIFISEWVGIGVFAIAIIGETLADYQLSHFKSKAENHGQVCQDGLWNYSRHPNYFFEWVYWLSLAIFALSSTFGVIGLIAPLAMLATLLFITGIPPSEAQSIQSKGDKYIEYQKTTSSFIPWRKG